MEKKIKSYLTDTFASVIFWNTIWLVIFLFNKVSLITALKMSIAGFLANLLLGGLYGKFLNYCRIKVNEQKPRNSINKYNRK